jgi:hypothetical protein
MSDREDLKQRLDLLDRTLEVYGGDLRRWPDGTRARLADLVTSSQDAKRRIAAARALDHVLDFAPRLSEVQNAALADRIVARAARQPRVVTRLELPPRRRLSDRINHGMAAAALAASLMIGILSGQNTTFASVTDALVGDNGAISSGAGQQMAQTDDADSLLDEDML